jgi:hypothetical protein
VDRLCVSRQRPAMARRSSRGNPASPTGGRWRLTLHRDELRCWQMTPLIEGFRPSLISRRFI